MKRTAVLIGHDCEGRTCTSNSASKQKQWNCRIKSMPCSRFMIIAFLVLFLLCFAQPSQAFVSFSRISLSKSLQSRSLQRPLLSKEYRYNSRDYRGVSLGSRPTSLRLSSGNFVSRFIRIVKSNVNSLLRFFESPEKMLDQALRDMQSDLLRVRQSYAEVVAAQRRMEKQKAQTEQLVSQWYERAQTAMAEGNEALAREALIRRQNQIEILETLEKQLGTHSSALDTLLSSMHSLESKIAEAAREKELLVARAKTAKTSVQINEMLSSLTFDDSTSVGAFERMKSEVESLETQAEISNSMAMTNLDSNVDIETKFASMLGKSKIDEAMEKLRSSTMIPLKMEDF